MTPEKLYAWKGDPDLKAAVVARMKEHRVQDEFIQGEYQKWAPETASKYKGCALGCTLPYVPTRERKLLNWTTFSEEIQKQYAISEHVADMIDNAFESFERLEDAGDFAVAVIEAIPVGADLSTVNCGGCGCGADDCDYPPLCLVCFDCANQDESIRIFTPAKQAAYAARFIEALATAPVPE